MPAVIVAGIVCLLGAVGITWAVGSFQGGGFFMLFLLSPLVLTVLLGFLLKSRGAQVCMASAAAIYGLVTTCFWLYVLFGKPSDPQDPIALAFAGIYASPFLVISWIVAAILNWSGATRKEPQI